MGNSFTRYRQNGSWARQGALAFLLAPVLPVLAYSLSTGETFLGAMMFGMAIAYVHARVLGLPLAWLVNRRQKISLLIGANATAP